MVLCNQQLMTWTVRFLQGVRPIKGWFESPGAHPSTFSAHGVDHRHK